MNNPININSYREMNLNPSAATGQRYRLVINDVLPLSSLKTEFNTFFPFLKIEFFKTPHKIGEGSAQNLLYNDTRMIKDCRVRQVNGFLDFTDMIPVSEFEERFLLEFGLSVQVFRKSGNVWLETSATDGWTLRQQNEEGRDLSTQIK